MSEESCPQWDATNPINSLNLLKDYVERKARLASKWYWDAKGPKAFFSSAIQLSCVVLAALTGLLPILLQFRGNPGPRSGLIASVLVGLTAALIGLDKAFGFSSGWTRYVLTATSIDKATEEFLMDWATLVAEIAPAAQPTSEQIGKMIQRAKDFSISVKGMVLQETKDWVTEFQASISQIEKDAKAQTDAVKTQREKEEAARVDARSLAAKDVEAKAAASAPGSWNITVENADKMDDFTFTGVASDSDREIRRTTISGALNWVEVGLPPGHYKLTVTAKKEGKPREGVIVADIGASKILSAKIVLPV